MRSQVVVIGGGVIGLSIAYALSDRGRQVLVVDRGEIGKESSWAGAGIIPPANFSTAIHPYDRLRGLSYELHSEWSTRLKERTQIDNGYMRCGGLYLARSAGEAASLYAMSLELSDLGVCCERLADEQVRNRFEFLGGPLSDGAIQAVYELPDEAQLRNPHHLRALTKACEQAGVVIAKHAGVRNFEISGGRLLSVDGVLGPIVADQFCFTAGAWTFALLQQLGITTGIMPIRGQIVLFRCDEVPFRCILNEGPRYLVPRSDGHVLVGSTEEEVGFDKTTTEESISELTKFARSLVPKLASARVVRSWAGLRPGSYDGLPYLGTIPGLSNAFVAAGHFRSGLFLSPATAVVMGQLMCDEEPSIDLRPFSVTRGPVR